MKHPRSRIGITAALAASMSFVPWACGGDRATSPGTTGVSGTGDGSADVDRVGSDGAAGDATSEPTDLRMAADDAAGIAIDAGGKDATTSAPQVCYSEGGLGPSVAAGAPGAYPYEPDMGDGTYRNPIVLADYSDPDVIRVGGDYYLVSSSFTNTPGLPILHSRDLVNWTLVAHALANVPGSRYAEYSTGTGVWAPAIRGHNGTFYIFFPTPDEGIFVTTAPNPTGPWSPPRLLVSGRGFIDPCPFWDDDGSAYLVHAYAGSRTGGYKDRLNVLRMSPDATMILETGPVVPGSGAPPGPVVVGTGTVVFGPDPVNYKTLEGPKFYKHNGWYYILAPARGVTDGIQTALRSKSVFGPYEIKVVLQQGDTPTNGPHQGALVDTPSGSEWWFVHFQDTGVYGRILHLEPVTWQDDWPVIGVAGDGGVQEPVLRHKKPDVCPQPGATPQTGDEFVGPDLSLAWQWHVNHSDSWYSLTANPGYLRLFPQSLAMPADGGTTADGGGLAGLAQIPNLLLQKVPSRSFNVDTVVSLTGTGGQSRAGLVVTGSSYAALSVAEVGGGMTVNFVVNDQTLASDTLPVGSVHLQLAFADGGQCRFSYGSDGGPLHSFAQPYQAQALKGSWNGVEVGIFAVASAGASAQGQADFSYFRFGTYP